MQRYFIEDAAQWSGTTVELTGEDARHLAKVMRAEAGDTFIASDGRSREVLAEIVSVEAHTVHAEVIEELPRENEPVQEIWVAQALPKADKLETVIQKGTEIGATGFLPFSSARTVVRYDRKKTAKKVDRWRKIAKEAAEQAERNRIPEVAEPVDWSSLMEKVPAFDVVLICYERQKGAGLKKVLQAYRSTPDLVSAGGKWLLLIGPEGGFTEQEVRAAEEAGARTAGLGKRILRTETAALVALTGILYEFDEMEG